MMYKTTLFQYFKASAAKFFVVLLVLLAVAAHTNKAYASDQFFWGVETYLKRVLDWGVQYGVPGKSQDESYAIIMNYIDDLGVNMIRDGSDFNALLPASDSAFRFSAMKRILEDLKKRGIVMDWCLTATPDWAIDTNFPYDPAWKCPPTDAAWSRLLNDIAQNIAPYAENVIFEAYNEPCHADFWSGTPARYLELLNTAVSELEGIRVINGGTVPGEANDNTFFNGYQSSLDRGLKYAAIHWHGDIESLRGAVSKVTSYGIRTDRIILNEAGYETSDDTGQAYQLSSKAIWSKANLAGFSAFFLGAINSSTNGDLGTDFALVTDTLKERPSYRAYKTTISLLKDAALVRRVHEAPGLYEYLFQRGDQQIYAIIGAIEHSPAEIASVLGSDGYNSYDMLGNLNGNYTNIQYHVLGNYEVKDPDTGDPDDNDEVKDPDTGDPDDNDEVKDPDTGDPYDNDEVKYPDTGYPGDNDGSGGGCSAAGFGMFGVLALAGYFTSKKRREK